MELMMSGGIGLKSNSKPVRNKRYMKWVRGLECEVCRCYGADVHHLIGHNQGGTGTKASDYFTFALCRKHHDELHRGVKTWESNYGVQWYFVAKTMKLAIISGVKSRSEFMQEIQNRVVNQLDREMLISWMDG